MAITLNGTTNTISGLAVGGLPDGIVDTDMLAANAVVTGKITDGTIASGDIASGVIPSGGVTEVDQWCISSDFGTDSGSSWETLTANWQRPTIATAADGSDLGTGMTQSSGIFTFPSTGFWLVTFQTTGYNSSNRQRFYVIIGTVAAGTISQSKTSIIDDGSSDWFESQSCTCILDITDTSADSGKIYFKVYSDGSMNVHGSGSELRTGATFIKLADT
tara:strand:+ start:68 stop:721 length:654 start_codon:yes stop_codon:yes gene_type:complete